MAVLVTRHRTLGVRLSEEEYVALQKFCADSGARSISDVARSAIESFLRQQVEEETIASTVTQNAVQVKHLEERLERLAALIATIKASSREQASKGASEVIGDPGL